MTVETKFSATRSTSWNEPFECLRCEWKGTVSVTTTGHGSATKEGIMSGPYGSGAREAVESAESAVNMMALHTIQFAQCPSCGWSTGTRLRARIRGVVLLVIGIGSFAARPFIPYEGTLKLINWGLFAMGVITLLWAAGVFLNIPKASDLQYTRNEPNKPPNGG